MSVHTHILPDQAIKPFTNHSTLSLSSKSTTLRMLPRHLWRSWNGRRYLWGKLHQNSDPVSQVCVDLPLLNITYLSTQVHRKAYSIRWLRILWAHRSKSNEAQFEKRLPLNNLRTMNNLRTYGTPAHMCCATSTAWKQVRNAEPPKTATGSLNTFPRFQIMCSSKAIFTSVLKSFGEFSVFLCLPLATVTVASWVSPRSGWQRCKAPKPSSSADTWETCRILQDHVKHVFFPLFSNHVFVEFDALLGHIMNINEWSTQKRDFCNENTPILSTG